MRTGDLNTERAAESELTIRQAAITIARTFMGRVSREHAAYRRAEQGTVRGSLTAPTKHLQRLDSDTHPFSEPRGPPAAAGKMSMH